MVNTDELEITRKMAEQTRSKARTLYAGTIRSRLGGDNALIYC